MQFPTSGLIVLAKFCQFIPGKMLPWMEWVGGMYVGGRVARDILMHLHKDAYLKELYYLFEALLNFWVLNLATFGDFLYTLITLSVRYFFLSLLLQLCLFFFFFLPQPFQRASLPKFLIRGHLSSTNCIITQPLTGELVVENAEAAVKSIELQLVRVETCGKFSVNGMRVDCSNYYLHTFSLNVKDCQKPCS